MKGVRIAELTARLREYIRAVRNGETISVLDWDTPGRAIRSGSRCTANADGTRHSAISSRDSVT